jgi:hypothetical protein
MMYVEGSNPVTEMGGRGGGVELVTQLLYHFYFINANQILTQYFIMEPKWENHKLFSIHCKILFYMLHRRTIFFIFYQHQLIKMYPHPCSLEKTGRRLQTPI